MALCRELNTCQLVATATAKPIECKLREQVRFTVSRIVYHNKKQDKNTTQKGGSKRIGFFGVGIDRGNSQNTARCVE